MTSQPGPHEGAQVDERTIDLLLEHVKDTPQRQNETALSLDSKAIQVFGAGSIVIGLVATSDLDAPLRLVLAAVVFYGIAAAATIFALWVRKLRVCDSPAILWPTFWSHAPREVKHGIIHDLAEGDAENERKLNWKRRALLTVLVATFVEVVLVGAAVSVALGQASDARGVGVARAVEAEACRGGAVARSSAEVEVATTVAAARGASIRRAAPVLA